LDLERVIDLSLAVMILKWFGGGGLNNGAGPNTNQIKRKVSYPHPHPPQNFFSRSKKFVKKNLVLEINFKD
jgi:hypothetical protein